ncbi:hypothetical protein [Inconstantimicrobium mannanitabidum]|uniref:Uncharacterized protein n=1 Tax=Inconstantimicrobium mannanitabidum TaxID=1604901 RepID=A0ACB5R6Z8_9CLOT|nr:hypothetical protein [Clostridium sp. TW13]GKX64783.1 hypothetical protein rsdtw13_00410 [Clostridium sp. TW13]
MYAAEEAVKNGIIVKGSNAYKMYLADAYFTTYSEGDITRDNYLYGIEHINFHSVI